MQKLHDDGDFYLCDYPNCNKAAVAESTIYDEDGEDQGCEMLCALHHPHYSKSKSNTSKDAYPEMEAFFDRLSRKGSHIGF